MTDNFCGCEVYGNFPSKRNYIPNFLQISSLSDTSKFAILHLFTTLKDIYLEGFVYRRKYDKRANLKTGVTKKQSTLNFPKNEHLPSDTHTQVRASGSKKCLFFGKCGMLCFLVTPVLRFVLLAYYRRYNLTIWPCSLILLCLKHSRKIFCSQFALPETGDWGKEVDRRENYLWISGSRRGFCGQLFSYYFPNH